MKKNEINVLIVEDDSSQRDSLSEAVKRKGFRPVAVAKPEEAESIVKIKPIHGLIIDCMLPGRNGVDLAIRLKENLLDNAGIVFVSGIYRDKGYAQEALRKTDALEFFHKPYDLEKVMGVLEKRLSEFIDKPKVDLHALLSAPSASARERRKALDHVEDVQGYDLPFIFCILMDAESSGYLNIVDEENNIYGVTLAKGAIARVDSERTLLLTKKILIQHGFITELDLSEYSEKKKTGDLIKNLVNEGLMSPHVPSVIRKEQIVEEIKKLLEPKKLNFNFVPDRKIKDDPTAVDMAAFINDLHDFVMQLPIEYLKKFYTVWSGHPIRLGPQYQEQIYIMGLPLVARCENILDFFKKECTIEDILAQSQIKEDDFYRALHFLAIRRVIVFEEVRRVRNLDEHVNRLKSMHKALVGKTPIEIFEYFGLSSNPKAADVTKLYKEFAKANHPDTLPQAVSPEVRQLNHELFSAVTNAHDILSDENKRKVYFDSIKQEEAHRQVRAEELIAEARALMSRGHYSEALPKLEEAKVLYTSDYTQLHLLWGKFKTEGRVKVNDLPGIEAYLKSVAQETKKDAIYLYVLGLWKKAAGDLQGAFDEFSKALQADPEFADARRDRSAVRSQTPQKMSGKDFLTGDITAVLGNFLKKKKTG